MVWAGQPLMAIILLAALQTIPARALRGGAASTAPMRGSASGYITMPHLLPTILFIVLLRMIWMSNHIDMIFIMTRGGPGFTNYTEAVYSFMLTQQFQIGYSSAVAVVLAIILMTASALYVRHLARTGARSHRHDRRQKRQLRSRRVGSPSARRAVLLYSLAPFLWMFVASITPELRPTSAGRG